MHKCKHNLLSSSSVACMYICPGLTNLDWIIVYVHWSCASIKLNRLSLFELPSKVLPGHFHQGKPVPHYL